MKILFLFILFLSNIFPQTVINYDDELIIKRLPKENIIDKYRNNELYNYDIEIITKESFLSKIKRYIISLLRDIFGSRIYNEIEYYLFLLIFIISAIIIFNGLIKSKTRKLYYSPGELNNKYDFTNNINIHNYDLKYELVKAVENKDWVLCVKLNYLISLKLLAENKIIKWEISKSNHNYCNELSDNNLRNDFENLTRIFEYVLYGNYLINENIYRNIENSFNNFCKRIEASI